MKRMIPTPFTVLCVLLLFAAVSTAQITLTRTDMENVLMNSIRSNTTLQYSIPAAIELGATSGSMQSFNFSSLPTEDTRDTSHQTFEDPVGKPGTAEFPGATLCTPFVIDLGGGGSTTTVLYFSIEDDGFYLLGSYSHNLIPPFFDTVVVQKHRPKQLFIPLPFTYGTSRTAVDTLDTDTSQNDFTVTTQTITCDGWGDITFPSFTGPAVPKVEIVSGLRYTVNEVQEYYFNSIFISRNKNVRVGYITADGIVMEVEQTDTTYTGGVANVQSIDYSEPVAITDVRPVSSGIPDEFSISANYPNPFNPSTAIRFTVPVQEYVSLKVFDLLGREVTELVGDEMAPGIYEVVFDSKDLPSGIYIYRMTAGSFVRGMKMNVIK